MPAEQVDYLLPGKVVPSRPILIAKTGKHVDAAFFQDSVNACYEFCSLFNLNMVEATHVKNKIELFIVEGQIDEAFV